MGLDTTMCGRFYLSVTPQVIQLLDDLDVETELSSQYNIAPTETVPIITRDGNHNQCHMARWWLTPSWSSGPDTKFSMFNARAENLENSRAYKGPFRHKRCIIPCSSFIEWQKTPSGKQPVELYQPGGVIAFAGLWDCWNDELLSCSIVTTEAASEIQPIHHRMPVMLNRETMPLWLDTRQPTDNLKPLFAPQLPHPIASRPVDTSVNNSRNKTLPIPLA